MQITDSLDHELLGAFTEKFFGYGSLSGAYWFVGIEEGGGNSFKEVDARLRTWHRRGRLELEDASEFSNQIGLSQWFGAKARLQRTWEKYIRVIFGAESIDARDERVLRYQSEVLGRFGGGSCVMNLLPLPSPTQNHWHYSDWSTISHLACPDAYVDHYASIRAEHIRRRVLRCRPKAVLLASVAKRYRAHWQSIAGVKLEYRRLVGRSCYFGSSSSTIFVVSQHPSTKDIENDYFRLIGEYIAEHTRECAETG